MSADACFEYRLCFVKGNFAYFTTQPVGEQRGDDWDDVPYEHNAERPYAPRDGDDWKLYEVAFAPEFRQPYDGHANSPYSVREINGTGVPWLKTWSGGETLEAGATYAEFVRFVESNGGAVFEPRGKRMILIENVIPV